MAEEPLDRLAAHGREPAPAPDPRFADRLETSLRIAHAADVRPGKSRRGARRYGLGLALASVVVLAGFLGVSRLSADDPGVPLEVTDEGVIDSDAAAIDAGEDADGGSDADKPLDTQGDAVPTSTLTATPTATPTPTATATPAPTVTSAPSDSVTDVRPTTIPPTDAPDTPTEATPTPGFAVAPTQVPTQVPTLVPAPTAAPTVLATPVPTATAVPVPRPTPTAPPSPSPSPTPTPRPTIAPAPAAISLRCAVRTVGDVFGVLCEWNRPADVAFDRYVLLRSRNGAEPEVIATRQPGAERMVVDRDVSAGDTVTYIVRALRGDAVVAASPRVAVRVPTG